MKEHFQGLAHVAVYTRDMEESTAFYEKLGGEVQARDGVVTPSGEKKLVLVSFGGLENWFFTGPSGEQIELLHMLRGL